MMRTSQTAFNTSLLPASPDIRNRISDIVSAAPANRSLLEKLGFDTAATADCSLAEACEALGLDARTVATMLNVFADLPSAAPATAIEVMSLSELCDHLETVRHPSLEKQLARLDSLARSIVAEQGVEEPRFKLIQEHFHVFRKKILEHLRDEAEVLFPLIRRNDVGAEQGEIERLRIPLERMKEEHNEADEDLAALEAFTAEDPATAPAARSMRLLRDSFQNLERILQGQIYQENQVLFRRALASLASS